MSEFDRWWHEFAEAADTIGRVFSEGAEFDVPGFMLEHLQSINPDLMWEYGRAIDGSGHRLVITPETRRDLRPMVRELLKRAPQIEGWEFFSYRLAEDLAQVRLSVKGRTGYSLDGLEVRASINPLRGIDLLFQSPDVSGPDDRQWLDTAFIACETALGEKVLDRWIGSIELQRRPGKLQSLLAKRAAGFVAMERFASTVESLIESIREQMPDTPYSETEPMPRTQGREWTTFKLDPPELDSYPGCSDMLIASSADASLFRAVRGPGFASERFSKLGETFCYLKIDGEHRPPGGEADYRGRLEDLVDEALNDARLGCAWGGGTGLKYSYIDLVLTDVPKSIPCIRESLRKAGIPQESWLLFYDADLACEWVGLCDQTPPPPQAAEADDASS